MATAPTGAWSGKAAQLALYDGTAWLFYTPQKGWLVSVLRESKYYWFDENWMSLQVESPTADFDEDSVRNTTLDGLEAIAASGSMVETDTVLSTIAKFRAQISTLTAPPNDGDVTDIGAVRRCFIYHITNYHHSARLLVAQHS